MSPILGIYASQISGHLWEPSGAYDALWSTTLAASASSITISNIPSTYKHLQVRYIAKASANDQDVWVNFNGDTATNYSEHRIYADGSTIVSGGAANVAKIEYFGRTSTGTNNFAANIVDILDYANTNKYKTTRALYGWDNNGSAFLMFSSGNWRSTAAITSMTITPQSGTFSQYSSFALYGIK